jgi:hypothetical protein
MTDEITTQGAVTEEDVVTGTTFLTGDTSTDTPDPTLDADGKPLAPETKLDADGKPLAEGDTDDGSLAAPESYADFTMPEGFNLDETLLAEALPIFKELELTQEQAQKLVDFKAKEVQAGQKLQQETFNQLISDWGDQSKSDKEFGGDKFEENTKIAQHAVATYGTDALRVFLNEQGVGNHPEMIRFMFRVGKTLGEDIPGGEGNLVTDKGDRASRMYPTKNN